MKMWAVFNQNNVQVSDPYPNTVTFAEICASNFSTASNFEEQGYTAQPVVVMPEDVYNGMRGWTKTVAKGWDKFNYPVIEAFLKAGE